MLEITILVRVNFSLTMKTMSRYFTTTLLLAFFLHFVAIISLAQSHLQSQADINKDQRVNLADYNIFISVFGKSGNNLAADINRNGMIDLPDFNILITYFGLTVSPITSLEPTITDSNQPGTYGIRVTVISQHTQTEVLDAKVAIGAHVQLFDQKTQKEIASLITEGGNDIFWNLPPGDYIVQANYAGKTKNGYTSPSNVTLVANQENENTNVMLRLPLYPDEIKDYYANVKGTVRSNFEEFYSSKYMSNVPIKLLRVERGTGITTVVGTTTTDQFGQFIFNNIKGNELYRYDYTPPTGWELKGDLNYHTFQVYSTKDRIVDIDVSKP